MKVTIKKIAEIAGVHPATVDKVLHNRPGVSDEVREKVRKLIDDLGYKPNPAGLVLQKQGRQYCFDEIMVNVDALPFIQKGIEKGIREQTGFEIRVRQHITSFQDAEGQAKEIDLAVKEKTDGIILTPINSERVRDAIRRAAAAGIPVVTVNSDIENSDRLCYVGQDGRRASIVAGRLMGQLLNGKGRVGIISSVIKEENNSFFVRVREQGFREFITMNYPEIEIIAEAEGLEDPETTYTETKKLLHAHPDLDGIYITCGGVAQIGKALRESGRSIHALSFEAYPHILELMQDGIIDCTIGSELVRQGEVPIHIIMDKIVLGKVPQEEQIYTDIRILVKECFS